MWPTVLASVVTVLALIITALTTPDQMTLRRPLPYVLVVAGLFTLAMIWWQYLDQQRELDVTRRQYTEITEELRKARKELSDIKGQSDAVQPKLVPLSEKTVQRRDEQSGLIHTTYYFRSQHPSPLRDVRIELGFDSPFEDASGRIVGAFVIEQGSSMRHHPDRTGLAYSTGLLKEGNDIAIQVVSKAPLRVVSSRLSP